MTRAQLYKGDFLAIFARLGKVFKFRAISKVGDKEESVEVERILQEGRRLSIRRNSSAKN